MHQQQHIAIDVNLVPERQNTTSCDFRLTTDLRSAREGLIHYSCDSDAMLVVLVLIRRRERWCIITNSYRLLAVHTATVIV
jgi:hypothetical protein